MRKIDIVKEALAQNADHVFDSVAALIVNLGAKPEWSMGDNFATTEGLAGLASEVGLPEAGDQSDEALLFWRAIADEEDIYYPEDDVIGGPR